MLKMSGDIPLLPVCAFLACTRTINVYLLTCSLFKNADSSENYKHQIVLVVTEKYERKWKEVIATYLRHFTEFFWRN
jgi:hypothetical protein